MYDVGVMGNGALAGLVAITSGTSTIEPWGAIIVGFVAGGLYILGSKCSVWFKVRQLLPSSQRVFPGFSTASLHSPALSEDPELRMCDCRHLACLEQRMQ